MMSSSTTTTVTCPINTSRAADIAALLHHPPPSTTTHPYYTTRLSSLHLSSTLSITPSPHHGKGLFSLQEFNPNDLVFKDKMLFGIQHSSNKFDCLVCSFCYRFVGSVEVQVGRRLYFQELGVGSSCCNDEERGENGGGGGGSGLMVPEGVLDSSRCNDEECENGGGRRRGLGLPDGAVNSSFCNDEEGENGGGLRVLDGVVDSSLCNDEECENDGVVDSSHCNDEEGENDGVVGSSFYNDNDEDGENGRSRLRVPEGVVDGFMNGGLKLPYSDQFKLPDVVSCLGGCKEAYYCSTECAEADWEAYHSLLCTGERSSALSTKALSNFVQHANETNDIFLLAAQVISFVILRYRKFKEARLREINDDHKKIRSSYNNPLLMKAWEPVAMGHKSRWWECISLPDDVDDECSYRMQVKELAFESLQLLKKAIYDEECEPLFSLEIYGQIIGMFEQNNLDLVVGSPLGDYFLYIDDLPQNDKKVAEKLTRPILEALGDDYSICCQGTAFFPLQSCMNHSCRPNARAFKREQDRDGEATIIALEHIQKGEEITISYIDEELCFEERQLLLEDYGFTCKCPKCSEEA